MLENGLPVWGEILAAIVLDALIGDPSWFILHPVRIIGAWIGWFEKLLRNFVQKRPTLDAGADLKRAGVVLCLVTVIASGVIAWALPFALTKAIGPLFGSIARIIVIYFALAARSLDSTARKVARTLDEGDLNKARGAVGHLVGRDTDKLSFQGVARAACESVAENSTDGVIAPMFFVCFGAMLNYPAIGHLGAALAWLYKASSTLDSMVGYDNAKYRYLGWCSAKLDDVLAYLPARLGGALMCAAALITGCDAKAALRLTVTQHGAHASPNSGWTEAAASGALGIRMGGGAYYGGQWKASPQIGYDIHNPDARMIRKCLLLMWVAMLLCAAIGILLPRYMVFIAFGMALFSMFAGRIPNFGAGGRK